MRVREEAVFHGKWKPERVRVGDVDQEIEDEGVVVGAVLQLVAEVDLQVFLESSARSRRRAADTERR